MRCISYCTASAFDIPKLFQFLSTTHTVQLFRDAIYMGILDDQDHQKEIFYFSYGAIVFWGLDEEEERKALNIVKEFEKDPYAEMELDEFTYSYGSNMKIEDDEISLHNKHVLTKLAISHGLAQSAKLTTFEVLIQKTIDLTKHIPAELARKGKIPLSRKEISKKMGELFMERNFINLHADILDTPEFFWDYPELEPFYRKTSHYLDVGKRVDILNKRLNIIHELLEILSGEMNHQHSSRLEWTIIVLILIEVSLVVLKDLFHVI
jgi:uncharacterized Rmd1/YagE family protein